MVSDIVRELIDRGVVIHNPDTVYVDQNVDISSIAAGVTIYPGCRIMGSGTVIDSGCVLGYEAPATIDGCQLGRDVHLRGGYYSNSTFLDGVRFGSQAHVRHETLIEENVICGPGVSMKQTVVMPYVMMGSMINFSDALMSGGTGHDNCSEVGSSYVHFNFSAHQDKATPSLIGDVPHGVLLNMSPVFLGGQGGIVGPLRIAFGTTIAAGTICRRDILEEGQLMYGESFHRSGVQEYDPELYGDVCNIIRNNASYLGNLHALRYWYSQVRILFVKDNHLAAKCHSSAVGRIESMIKERLLQLDLFAERMRRAAMHAAETGHNIEVAPHALHRHFGEEWAGIRDLLDIESVDDMRLDVCMAEFAAGMDCSMSYLDAVKRLSDGDRETVTKILSSIADSVAERFSCFGV